MEGSEAHSDKYGENLFRYDNKMKQYDKNLYQYDKEMKRYDISL